jgi:hypothetical protein
MNDREVLEKRERDRERYHLTKTEEAKHNRRIGATELMQLIKSRLNDNRLLNAQIDAYIDQAFFEYVTGEPAPLFMSNARRYKSE